MSDTEKALEKLHEGLTGDQKLAVDHIRSHARLLAGPGTGKTTVLTKRVLSLILKHNVDPSEILLLTFTRLAANQLREKMKEVLDPLNINTPEVATLHSFALKQLIHNSGRVSTLPKPLRIANDWEERHIIQEDLKRLLGSKKISDVKEMIYQLSADWETLRVDEVGWEEQFPNAAFLGVWRKHREIYGITLRAELVYQLKKCLNQSGNFKLDKEYKHLLVDEYQDFNRCDMAVVREIEKTGAEIFVVGDDDQSIYGFRFADPVGIREFPDVYENSTRLVLDVCFRCDKKILKYADFVADLDPKRLPKPTKPKSDASDGVVKLIKFPSQYEEADNIAKKIVQIIKNGTPPKEIVILLRSDRNRVMSKPLVEALAKQNVKVALTRGSELDEMPVYHLVIAYIHLLVNQQDSLALRSALQIEANGIGEECIGLLYDYAEKNGLSFSQAVEKAKTEIVPNKKYNEKLKKVFESIEKKIQTCVSATDVKQQLAELVNCIVSDEALKEKINAHFISIIDDQKVSSLSDFLTILSTISEKIEQDTEEDAVSILTMHQAKGLTFAVCFIVGVEDEIIPGRSSGEKEGDERRLLYVSMTRAKHQLYMTYCDKRLREQSFVGRDSGKSARSLTKFLSDAKLPLVVVNK